MKAKLSCTLGRTGSALCHIKVRLRVVPRESKAVDGVVSLYAQLVARGQPWWVGMMGAHAQLL